MFRSLRFRLPAFFLAGIVLAGLLATAIAIVVFQSYTRDRTVGSLRREAKGLAALYAEQANRDAFSSKHLEEATGNQLFYVGLSLFPGQKPSLRKLPNNTIDWLSGRVVEFHFTPPGEHRRFLAVAQPVKLGREVFGALVVATPEATLRSAWLTIMERLAIAFAAGILLAGALGWYLSRRITGPVLGLSRSADEISKGSYDVAVPEVRSRDEINQLSESFQRMAQRLEQADMLERNFLLAVSHELRTPLTAIRGHVDALREGVVSDGDRVLQIISNLLENAFRWTPDGGRIELALTGENGALAVAVTDTGPGIGAEERERIFRPFWSRDGSGTGLGLAISRELALALGGRIVLRSEPGQGSSFKLTLPSQRQ